MDELKRVNVSQLNCWLFGSIGTPLWCTGETGRSPGRRTEQIERSAPNWLSRLQGSVWRVNGRLNLVLELEEHTSLALVTGSATERNTSTRHNGNVFISPYLCFDSSILFIIRKLHNIWAIRQATPYSCCCMRANFRTHRMHSIDAAYCDRCRT